MADRKASEFIAEQLAIDALLNNLDRNLFYLPKRVQYSEYISRLGGKRIMEERRVGITLEIDYEINWNTIIPERDFELNPTISQYFENPVKLRTTFFRDIIKSQILVFTMPAAADIVFELFRSNSMWEAAKTATGLEHLKSVDGKYILTIVTHESEFGWDNSHHILLLYKD